MENTQQRKYPKQKQKFHKRPPQETPLQKIERRREALKQAEYKAAMGMYRLPDGSLIVSDAYYEQVADIELEYKREMQKQKVAEEPVRNSHFPAELF